MELELTSQEGIEVEVEGIKLSFAKSTKQDVVYASSLIDYLDFARSPRETPIGKEKAIAHVFSKLKSFTGELAVGGEKLTVERLRDLALNIKGRFIGAVCVDWSLRVLEAQGYLDLGNPDEKKENTQPSDSSAQPSSTEI